MKREVANVLAVMLAGMPATSWRNITAYQMDGSGWDQSVDDLIALLDQERYIMYDISITKDGLDIDVWFTTLQLG